MCLEVNVLWECRLHQLPQDALPRVMLLRTQSWTQDSLIVGGNSWTRWKTICCLWHVFNITYFDITFYQMCASDVSSWVRETRITLATENVSLIFTSISNKPNRGKIVNITIFSVEIMQNIWEKALEIKQVRSVNRTKYNIANSKTEWQNMSSFLTLRSARQNAYTQQQCGARCATFCVP